MWKQNIPNWIPLAGLITGKVDSPFFTRIAELLIVGIVSGVATLRTLESDVSALKANTVTKVEFAMHEKQNADDRDRVAKEKVDEDRKWDARITRLENCFIVHDCRPLR